MLNSKCTSHVFFISSHEKSLQFLLLLDFYTITRRKENGKFKELWNDDLLKIFLLNYRIVLVLKFLFVCLIQNFLIAHGVASMCIFPLIATRGQCPSLAFYWYFPLIFDEKPWQSVAYVICCCVISYSITLPSLIVVCGHFLLNSRSHTEPTNSLLHWFQLL